MEFKLMLQNHLFLQKVSLVKKMLRLLKKFLQYIVDKQFGQHLYRFRLSIEYKLKIQPH